MRRYRDRIMSPSTLRHYQLPEAAQRTYLADRRSKPDPDKGGFNGHADREIFMVYACKHHDVSPMMHCLLFMLFDRHLSRRSR